MKKGKKKAKNIILISALILAITFLGFFQLTNSVIGVSNELEYSNNWKNQDLSTGMYSTIATLTVPDKTETFSFTPNYNFRTYKNNGGDVSISVIYQVFNYNSNSYETIINDNWNLRNDYGEQNKFTMDGESVYNNGLPEHLEAMRTGSSSYDRYYACLDGMNINEAKELNPWLEGTSSYTYKCLYPGNSLVKHEYGDDSDENYDIEYFPKLITLNSNYVNGTEVLFKIDVNIKTSGIDSVNANDFEIDLWELKTETIDTYQYIDGLCEYQSKYTYQISDSDYFTKNECYYQNNVIDCYKDIQCDCDEGLISECQGGECVCEKPNLLNQLFPNNDEPSDEEVNVIYPEGDEPVNSVNKPSFKITNLIFPLIILTLIILIIRNVAKKRKK